MKFVKSAWNWIMKHAVAIIIGLAVFAFSWANIEILKSETKQKDAEFKCQTLCFPQQHEYLFVGEVGSCWCYTSSDELKRYKE